MYNTELTVKYADTTEYQTALLSAFYLKEYSDELPNMICEVCRELNLTAPDMAGVDEESRFMLLFSYDQFEDTHTRICSLKR